MPRALLAIAVLVAATAGAEVPDRVPYQGRLLDPLGDAREGPVDLTLRVYDALLGGVLVYTQLRPGVALIDGVFQIELGPTGEAGGAPADPLTQDLRQALVGELAGAGPERFLEIEVDGELLLPRTQLLATPFALRSAQADVAQTALDAQAVGGLDSAFVTQLFEHSNSDEQGPGNADPREGLADVDGDGRANFIDPDNDGDGIFDFREELDGTDLNLVTPVIQRFEPAQADGFVTTRIAVIGENFEPGLTVAFGEQTPAALSVTPTRFEVDVGPQPPELVDVRVTLPNGEGAEDDYGFFFFTPEFDGVDPPFGSTIEPSRVMVHGDFFSPGLTVRIGDQTPAPEDLTPSSFEVTLEPRPPGPVDVEITLANGNGVLAEAGFEFSLRHFHGVGLGSRTQLGFDHVPGTRTVLVSGAAEYAVDTDDDARPDLELPLATANANVLGPGQIAVAFDPSGTLAGLRCRVKTLGGCDLEFKRDADGDLALEDEIPTVLDTATGFARLWSPDIQFDPGDNAVLGYVLVKFASRAYIAHDRDGDGSFDASEIADIATVGGNQTSNAGELAVDSLGRPAYLFWSNNGFALQLAHDRSNDGDYSGPAELVDLATNLGLPSCLGLAFDPADRPVAVWGDPGSEELHLARDLDGDGAFDGAGEDVVLPGGGTATACDVAWPSDGVLSLVHDAGGLTLLLDLSGDGDFDDPDEELFIESFESREAELRMQGTERAFIATDVVTYEIVLDP